MSKVLLFIRIYIFVRDDVVVVFVAIVVLVGVVIVALDVVFVMQMSLMLRLITLWLRSSVKCDFKHSHLPLNLVGGSHNKYLFQ